jgi:nucleoside-diphosphate-sugar epimerase
LEGVEYVFFVAHPVNTKEFTEYNDFINPVEVGTAALIEGIRKHKVKKVIMTSSGTTILGSSLHLEHRTIYDENDFAKVENKVGYVDSKII